jgi:uncharacterized membrane protein YfcA
MLYSLETLLGAGLCFLAAALVKGLTGLGFLTVCVASLVFVVGLKTAVGLVLVSSLLSNVFIMLDAGHFVETTRRFWRLYLASIPGVVVGVQLLTTIDQNLAAALLGSVAFGYSLVALAKPRLSIADRLKRPLQFPVGLAHGVVAGLTGSQVMPLVPYLFALGLEPAVLLQASNTIFTLCSLVAAVLLFQGGLLTPEIALLSLAGLVPTFVGVQLGSRLRRRLSGESFRLIVLFVILVLGLALIVRPLW